MKIPFLTRSKTEPKPIITGRQLRSQVESQQAKMIRQINGRVMRMYDASLSNGLNADFPVSISSANSEIFTSLWGVRSRARTLERDNPYVVAILETFRNNVCGNEPFRLEMKVGKWEGKTFVEEYETNRLIEEWWKEQGLPENCTVNRTLSRMEMDCQALVSIIRDGGWLAEHIRGFPKNRIGYALRVWEYDRLDHFWMGNNPQTGNRIKFSIELDEWDGPEAYWLLTKHPGEIYNLGESTEKYRRRVPAQDIIALFDLRTRAEQLTAISRLTSVISRLHRIDQFDIAHVTAAVWSACKPMFLTQEFPTAMEYIPEGLKKLIEEGMDGGDDGEGKRDAVEPGSVEELPWGKKPFQLDPKFPVENAPEFKKEQLRGVAAGSGSAYHMIANDLESVNFSSGRIGLDAFRDGCKILQTHFITNFRRPHFNEALKYAILSGRLDLPISRLEEFQRAATFYGRRWPYIQPLQDAQADKVRLEMKTTSRDQIVAESERGGRYEDVASQNASDDAVDKELGFAPFDPTGKAQPQEEKIEEPEGKKAGKN